jgi:uncharacterized membrane protein
VGKIGELIFKHPFAKAVGLSLFGILGNVFAGAYVFEITKINIDGHQFLDWEATPNSHSFWVLVLVILLMGAYGLGMARFERHISKELTEGEIKQRVIEALLEPTLRAVRKDIDEGRLWKMDDVMELMPSNVGKKNAN